MEASSCCSDEALGISAVFLCRKVLIKNANDHQQDVCCVEGEQRHQLCCEPGATLNAHDPQA